MLNTEHNTGPICSTPAFDILMGFDNNNVPSLVVYTYIYIYIMYEEYMYIHPHTYTHTMLLLRDKDF